MKFIWIDDDPDRKEAAEILEDALDVEVDFYGVNEKKVEDDVRNILMGEEPDLIILDHFLNQRASSEFFNTGSSLAFFMHEEWPSCPIIAVTNAENNDVDIRQKEAYEEMFQAKNIGDNYQKILSIASGFKKIKGANIESIDDLLDLLKPPDKDKQKIKKILPKELKENLHDSSLKLEIYRWINSVFIERPGFLFDKLWAATFLGLSIEGFDLITNVIEKARYTGIFSNESNRRWWKSMLLEILGEKTEDVGLPWVIGRSLVPNDRRFYSKCHISGEEFPETVAALDDTQNPDWYPMKLKLTEAHPNFEEMLFFEDMRILKID